MIIHVKCNKEPFLLTYLYTRWWWCIISLIQFFSFEIQQRKRSRERSNKEPSCSDLAYLVILSKSTRTQKDAKSWSEKNRNRPLYRLIKRTFNRQFRYGRRYPSSAKSPHDWLSVLRALLRRQRNLINNWKSALSFTSRPFPRFRKTMTRILIHSIHYKW